MLLRGPPTSWLCMLKAPLLSSRRQGGPGQVRGQDRGCSTHPGELSIGRRRTATCSAISVASCASAACCSMGGMESPLDDFRALWSFRGVRVLVDAAVWLRGVS
jgi:hypothetical protein